MQARQAVFAGLVALLALAPAVASADNRHHRGHHNNNGPRVGINLQFGTPYPAYRYGGYYNHWQPGWYGHPRWVYGPSYYYYNEIPVQHYETTRIIERPAPAQIAGPPPAQNWFLCEDSGYYYPHVTECASDWVVVPASPPSRR